MSHVARGTIAAAWLIPPSVSPGELYTWVEMPEPLPFEAARTRYVPVRRFDAPWSVPSKQSRGERALLMRVVRKRVRSVARPATTPKLPYWRRAGYQLGVGGKAGAAQWLRELLFAHAYSDARVAVAEGVPTECVRAWMRRLGVSTRGAVKLRRALLCG